MSTPHVRLYCRSPIPGATGGRHVEAHGAASVDTTTVILLAGFTEDCVTAQHRDELRDVLAERIPVGTAVELHCRDTGPTFAGWVASQLRQAGSTIVGARHVSDRPRGAITPTARRE